MLDFCWIHRTLNNLSRWFFGSIRKMSGKPSEALKQNAQPIKERLALVCFLRNKFAGANHGVRSFHFFASLLLLPACIFRNLLKTWYPYES